MDPTPPEFHDPALKDAIRRSIKPEPAPQSLRLKVTRTIQEAARPPTSKKALGLRAWRIAAVIALVSLGGLAIVLYDRGRPPMVEADLLAVLDTHDHCCKIEDHHLAELSRENWPEMGRQLSRRINVPVLLADLRADRWAFHGASICQINRRPSAHLVFSSDSRRISVFSIPIEAVPGARRNTRFATEVRGHVIVGKVNGQSVECMVGHCPTNSLSIDTLQALFDRHQSERVAAGNDEIRVLAAR